MKKLLLLLLLLTSSGIFAQEKDHYIAVLSGLDIGNASSGGKYTTYNPELNIITKFIMVGKGVEVNVLYERFEAINFSKYGFGIGYQLPLYGRLGNTVLKTTFIPSIEPCLIDRWGEEWEVSSSHLSIGANASFRWFFNDNLGAEILLNAIPRTDLKARYPEINSNVPIVYSSYICLIYKL